MVLYMIEDVLLSYNNFLNLIRLLSEKYMSILWIRFLLKPQYLVLRPFFEFFRSFILKIKFRHFSYFMGHPLSTHTKFPEKLTFLTP